MRLKKLSLLYFMLFSFVFILICFRISKADKVSLFLRLDAFPLNIEELSQVSFKRIEDSRIYFFSNIKIAYRGSSSYELTQRVNLIYKTTDNKPGCDWTIITSINEEEWLRIIRESPDYIMLRIKSDEKSIPPDAFDTDAKCYPALSDSNIIPDSKRIIITGSVVPHFAKPICNFLDDVLQVTLPNKKTIRFFPVKTGSLYFGATQSEISEGFKRIHTRLDYEGPQKSLEIKQPFWVSEFELTVGEFFCFLKNDRSFQNAIKSNTFNKWQKTWKEFYRKLSSSSTQEDDFEFPITKVLKSDIQHFIKWLNLADWTENNVSGYMFDLPTEVEWEYVAKGSSQNKWYFPWGNIEQGAENKAVFSVKKIEKVGSREAGKSWCNAQDVAGNVYELVRNSYFLYDDLPKMEAAGWTTINNEKYHVARGGAYSTSLWECRNSSRFKIFSDIRFPNIGARIFFVERE